MKKLSIVKLFFLVFTLFISSEKIFSQDCNCIVGYKNYTSQELKQKYTSLLSNKGFKKLVERVTNDGFVKIEDTLAAYGFTGKQENNKNIDDVSFVAFDFYDVKNNQTCSIIQRKRGKNTYTAYIKFPKGETNVEKCFDKSDEFFIDSNNKIVKAKSWKKCFKKCVKNECFSFCRHAIAGCGSVTADIIVGGAATTLPAGIGMFMVCAGGLCAGCFAICALGC